LSSVDYVTPNISEAQQLTRLSIKGRTEALTAATALLESGVRKAALVKMRGGGCIAVSREETIELPPITVTPVDKTGAGDAFAGAFGVAIAEGKSLHDAARFAVIAASLAVTGYGAQPSYPTREQIERELKVQSAMSELS
jgi:ribokinase